MRHTIGICLILIAVLVTTEGCGGEDCTFAGEKTASEIAVATVSESGGLDPAGVIANTFLAYSVSALDELLTYDSNGEIEYRAAESYEVNDEQTQWTFHLRENAVWSDGSPVISEDFCNTIRRSLDPLSGNGYVNYLFPIRHAEAIYRGEKDMSELGVETPDDHTLVFYLEKPCVYFLDLLRLPVYLPSCSAYADDVGSGWDVNPATSVSNGPYFLADYVPQQYFVLKKNQRYWNASSILIEQIKYCFFDSQQAMEAAYKTEEIDVATGLLSAVMDEYEGKKDLLITNSIATRYIYMNLDKVEAFKDIRVRKALNLGINREELCRMIGKDTEPSMNFVAKYMQDKTTGDYFAEGEAVLFEENAEKARELLARAGYPEGKGFPEITYSYPAAEMDSDTAQALQQQLEKNLGITIKLNAQELQVNYSERRAGNFELCRMNWTADFADPNTFLSMLRSDSAYNCSGIRDEFYDELLDASDVERDPVKRIGMLHEAERYAVAEQNYIIPLFSMRSVNLVRPDIEGITQIPATGALDYRHASVK